MTMFPERLRAARKTKELSQDDLGKMVGVNRAAIARWELGTREPNFKRLIELCDALEVSSDYLLGRTPHAK